MKGKIGTNAIIGGPDEPKFSDAEISELLEEETEVLITVLNNEKPDQGVHSSPSYIIRFMIYLNMYLFNRLIEAIINTIVFTLLYKQEAYQILNYRN